MHKDTVTRSWGQLSCHSSAAIPSCFSMIMDGPLSQGSVHNSWKLKISLFFHDLYTHKNLTPTHCWVFVYFDYFLHCRIIVETSKVLNNTSCSNQRSVKQIKTHILYLRFFKVATLCLDDRFAHSRPSLNQLHEVVTWNAFQ
jgi:hypothetical protein